MAKWDRLRVALSSVESSVTYSWRELDALVGGMPPSAADWPAWWSGKDRPHVRAWESAGFTFTNLVRGEQVTFVRRIGSRALTEPAPPKLPATESAPLPASSRRVVERAPSLERLEDVDCVLVACVKQKRTSPAAAKDLYISALFRKERAYAESTGRPWFILSAEYGLVAPDEWITPYDRHLPDTPQTYRTAWGTWAIERLSLLLGDLRGRQIEVHASSAYVAPLRRPLQARGAVLVDRLQGLNFFERLRAYGTSGVTELPDARSPVDRAVRLLTDRTTALTPAEFLSQPKTELRVPGLYSWWVDGTGAAELSTGLGLNLEPGLIYAGLAGATKWPSGKPSKNTLWGRIAGMHLGHKHKFSTFRHTLGSILANSEGRNTIDEDRLTTWMHEHLRVITVTHQDADTLGRLEWDVLASLDTPLNLDKVPASPIRSRVTSLRKQYA